MLKEIEENDILNKPKSPQEQDAKEEEALFMQAATAEAQKPEEEEEPVEEEGEPVEEEETEGYTEEEDV